MLTTVVERLETSVDVKLATCAELSALTSPEVKPPSCVDVKLATTEVCKAETLRPGVNDAIWLVPKPATWADVRSFTRSVVRLAMADV